MPEYGLYQACARYVPPRRHDGISLVLLPLLPQIGTSVERTRTVLGPSRSNRSSAASRSALPLASLRKVCSNSPFRFSINTCPMWLSLAWLPLDLVNNRASGSVVDSWVWFLRFSPRKSTSPPASGGFPPPSLGRKLL